MEGRALIEKSILPTDAILEEVLKASHKYYKSLMNTTEKFDNKWSYYKGWSQKVFDRKKALFYIIPYYGSFIVSMTIRENEKEKFMMNTILSYVHEQLKESEKYVEGYVVNFTVDDDESFEKCEKFIHELIEERLRKFK